MNRPSRIFALVEDRRQERFLFRFLVHCGLRRDEILIEISPAGKGSAEQWVRENFPRQMSKCRNRNTRASTGMFVMRDADTFTVAERLRQLDEALVAAGDPPIGEDHDPIARLIPKRNVETWIVYLYLRGASKSPIDEEQDYKRTRDPDEWSEMIPSAAEALWDWTRSGAPLSADLIPSLRHGIGEIVRLFRPRE